MRKFIGFVVAPVKAVVASAAFLTYAIIVFSAMVFSMVCVLPLVFLMDLDEGIKTLSDNWVKCILTWFGFTRN